MKRYRLTYVMEDRPIFWYLTVEENLQAASFSRWNKQVKADMENAFRVFPVLKPLRHRKAGYASGGEQQMLAIGMALMTKPRMLLLDEPSSALDEISGRVVETTAERLCRESGLTVVMVSHKRFEPKEIRPVILKVAEGRVVEQ